MCREERVQSVKLVGLRGGGVRGGGDDRQHGLGVGRACRHSVSCTGG